MKKTIKFAVICVVVLFIAIWIFALVRCEFLTVKYGDKFDTIYRENTMMGDIDYLKVLEYSDNSARVYYVSSDKAAGDVLTFVNNDGKWSYKDWEQTVWSASGSASGVVWTYWWHFVYGGF